MFELTPISALESNYIWAITSQTFPGKVVIVDPGASEPVIAFLQAQQLELAAILVTHHHYDHTNGLEALSQHSDCPIYAGAHEPVSQASVQLADGQSFQIAELGLSLTALHVPGHTDGHIAYFGHEMLFSGDTLFAAGCGRNFEGTHAQLYASLQRLAALPAETQVYCGHEYTEQNLRFGLAVEPNNQAITSKLALIEMMRSEQQCTLPSSLADEFNTNVFLRCEQDGVINAAQTWAEHALTSPEAVFGALRTWKDNFR
jgi:hydroxyacylglutathione hydrolase